MYTADIFTTDKTVLGAFADDGVIMAIDTMQENTTEKQCTERLEDQTHWSKIDPRNTHTMSQK